MIYLVVTHDEKYAKIGYSTSPHSRTHTLGLWQPLPFSLIETREGSFYLEKEIHRELSEFQTQGEWFLMNETVLEVFRKMLEPSRSVRTRTKKKFKAVDLSQI